MNREREMERKLNDVFSRHQDANPTQLMHNDRLGLKPHEKEAAQQQTTSKDQPHEGFVKSLSSKGPHMVKELHTAAKDVKELKGFAEDLARTFNL